MMQLANMLRFKMGWAEPAGAQPAIVLSSRVRLARNLRQFPFSAKASPKAFESTCKAAFEACKSTRAFSKAAYVHVGDLEPIERMFLVERRLISHQLASEPKNRGLVVGEREILSAMVNEEDHLRLQAIEGGVSIKALWHKLSLLDDELGQKLDFAGHPEWGFLTACPTNAGTGLRASVLLHLPALTMNGAINAILDGVSRVGMTARGLYGEGTRVIGDFYQFSNSVTLGRTEDELIQAVEKLVRSLITRETDAQKAASSGTNRLLFEDRVHRGLGALTHARTISFEETMQHLSFIRMALSLGWKLPFNLELLNELLVLTMPGHIQMLAGKNLDAPQCDFLRATLLRRKLKS